MNKRMPKIMLSYRPGGQKQFGRFLKRLFEGATAYQDLIHEG
jgi:hypothetical protein